MSDVTLIDIDTIDIGPRLRPVDGSAVPTLADSLKRDGLLQAIGVRRSAVMGGRNTLIWGAHRLDAAKHLNWTQIPARVYAASDLPKGVSATELEALENLSRTELAPYDRAMTIAGLLKAMREAAGLTEGQDGRAYNGANFEPETDLDDGVATKTVNFTVLVAQRVGLSETSVEKITALARNLRPDTAAAMRGREGWETASVVLACASLKDRLIDPMDPTKGKMRHGSGQDALITWLAANPKGGLRAALIALEIGGVEATPAQKAVNAVNNNWRNVPDRERVGVLGKLIGDLTPALRREILVNLDAAWQANALAELSAASAARSNGDDGL